MLSENHMVQLCGKLMSNGSQSAVSKSFNSLAHLYSLSYSQICNVGYATRKIKSLGNGCNENDFMNIEHIKSLLCMRQFILCRTAKGWFYNGRLKYNTRVFLCDYLKFFFFHNFCL